MHRGKNLQSTNHNKASRALIMCDNMSVDVLLCQITSSKWEGFLFFKKKVSDKSCFFVRGSPLSGRPTNLGYSRARAYCVYSSRG